MKWQNKPPHSFNLFTGRVWIHVQTAVKSLEVPEQCVLFVYHIFICNSINRRKLKFGKSLIHDTFSRSIVTTIFFFYQLSTILVCSSKDHLSNYLYKDSSDSLLNLFLNKCKNFFPLQKGFFWCVLVALGPRYFRILVMSYILAIVCHCTVCCPIYTVTAKKN